MSAKRASSLLAHVDDVVERAKVWSRTVATGTIDTSTSPEKAARFAVTSPDQGDAVRDPEDFVSAITNGCELLHEARPVDCTPSLLKRLNGVVAGSSLGGRLREHEATQYGYLEAHLVDAHMAGFCERVRNVDDHPAWSTSVLVDLMFDVHWSIDLRGHYFLDGCGRTALVFGAWLAVYVQGALFELPTRSEYLALAAHDEPAKAWRNLVAPLNRARSGDQ